MKTAKKWIALFLAVVTAFSVMTVSVSAEDAQQTQSRFVMDEDGLLAIDLSDQIQDVTTINDGVLWVNNGDEDYWSEARFDSEQPGLVHFGWFDGELNEFNMNSFGIGGYNFTYTLYAEEGNLYDDVPSYSFTTKDVFDSVSEYTTFYLWYPDVAVAKKDGDLVKELTLNFNPEWTGTDDFLMNTVDMDQEITMTAHLFGYTVAYRAVPVDFKEGALTVALYDGDKAGVAMHGLQYTIGTETYSMTEYNFTFLIPEGMFRYNDTVVNGEAEYWFWPPEIEGLPNRSVFQVPEWLRRLGSKLIINEALGNILFKVLRIPLTLILFPVFYRAIKKSFAAYGLDLNAQFREELRDGGWKILLKNLFSNM